MILQNMLPLDSIEPQNYILTMRQTTQQLLTCGVLVASLQSSLIRKYFSKQTKQRTILNVSLKC